MNHVGPESQAQTPPPPLPAGFHGRVMAAMVDMLLLLFLILQLYSLIQPVALWWYVILGVSADSVVTVDAFNQAASQGRGLQYLSENGYFIRAVADITFSYGLYTLYALPFVFWKGATPGKLLLGQRIVMVKSLELPPRPVLVMRHLAYIASFVPFMVGFFYVAFNRDRRGFHDLIAGTRVILTRGPLLKRFAPPTPQKVLGFYKSLLSKDKTPDQ